MFYGSGNADTNPEELGLFIPGVSQQAYGCAGGPAEDLLRSVGNVESAVLLPEHLTGNVEHAYRAVSCPEVDPDADPRGSVEHEAPGRATARCCCCTRMRYQACSQERTKTVHDARTSKTTLLYQFGFGTWAAIAKQLEEIASTGSHLHGSDITPM